MAIIEADVTTRQVAMAFDYGQIDEGIRDEVKEAAKSIRAYGQSFKGSMIQIGKRLIEVKGMLPEKQFGAWIEAEFDLSHRMAQNFMNVARVYGNKQGEIISSLSDTVLYLLSSPSTPEAARVEVEQAALNGQRVTVHDAKKAAAKFTEPKPTKPRAEVKRVAEPYQSPTPTPAKVVYVEPEPVTPPDLVAAGYTILRDGDAWGWKREGDYKVDSYRQRPLGEVITGYPGGKPFADAKTAIEEARRDLLTGIKCGPTSDYYPVKHGPAVMHADLVVAGYELVGGDGDDPADGKHGYRWRFDGEMGPNVAYAGAAIEGARMHLAANTTPNELEAVALVAAEQAEEDAQRAAREAMRPSFENVPEPIIEAAPQPTSMLTPEWVVFVLIHYTPINADFKTALKAATLDDLREAMAGFDQEEKHWRARLDALNGRYAELMAPPDPRIARARAGIETINACRVWVRNNYLELTGLEVNTLAYWRDTAGMLERLESLVNILTRKEVTK